VALVLADVGGTNVRFATVTERDARPTNVQRFENDGFARFDDALAAYLAKADLPNPQALSVAVAGPVTGLAARLTNRDWRIHRAELADDFGFDEVYLLNDLSALGYALDLIEPSGLAPVIAGAGESSPEDQRLVIGIGTGVNVSPVLRIGGKSVCLLAEAGLGSLPIRVERVMARYLNAPAPWVRCAEDAVRGPGLAALHAAATGGDGMDTRAVMAAAADGDPAARGSVDVFAEMVGELVQDLRLLYMPRGGIFLAGSVSRGLLESHARDTLLRVLTAQPSVKSELPQVSVSLITQDEAALLGCLSYARLMQGAI